jgi:hypothetical protein
MILLLVRFEIALYVTRPHRILGEASLSAILSYMSSPVTLHGLHCFMPSLRLCCKQASLHMCVCAGGGGVERER